MVRMLLVSPFQLCGISYGPASTINRCFSGTRLSDRSGTRGVMAFAPFHCPSSSQRTLEAPERPSDIHSSCSEGYDEIPLPNQEHNARVVRLRKLRKLSARRLIVQDTTPLSPQQTIRPSTIAPDLPAYSRDITSDSDDSQCEMPLPNQEHNARVIRLRKLKKINAQRLAMKVTTPPTSLRAISPVKRARPPEWSPVTSNRCKRTRMNPPDSDSPMPHLFSALATNTSNQLLRRSPRKPIPSKSAAQKQAIGI